MYRPALCLCLPGSGDWGPSPACTARHRLEQRQKLDRQTEERVLHNMCGDNRGPDNNWSVFWKYISRVHHRAILYDIHVREGRSVVSSPALWTMQTPRSEEIQSSRESGHPVWWRHRLVTSPVLHIWVKLKHTCGHRSGCVLFTHSSSVGRGGAAHHGYNLRAFHPACVSIVLLKRLVFFMKRWLCPSWNCQTLLHKLQ